MADLSYYLKYTGQNNTHKDLIITEMVDNYNENYNNAITKFEVMINTDRADIGYINLDNTNQIRLLLDIENDVNKNSFKPSLWRSLWVQPNKLKTGDYITIRNKVRNNEETYMIMDMYEDRNSYDLCYMQYCNITMKFICPIDKTTIHEIWCIKSNMSLYSIGTEQNKYFVSEDGKRLVVVPLNDITKELYVGQRFILDSEPFVFKITEIYNNNGVLEIKMGQVSEIIGKDNFELHIAYNDGINIIQPPLTPDYTIQIIGDSEIQQGYSKQYQAKVYNNGAEVTEPVIWSIDNPTNASIAPNGNTCSVQGLIQGVYVILTAKLAQDNSVLITKDIYIGGGW